MHKVAGWPKRPDYPCRSLKRRDGLHHSRELHGWNHANNGCDEYSGHLRAGDGGHEKTKAGTCCDVQKCADGQR